MEIRVIKMEIPTEGDPAYGGAPYADRTVTVDANGHALPSSPAKAWVCVANGAATMVAGSTDHLTGSLGFTAPVNGIEGTGSKSYSAAYYSTDNVGTTVAKRRTTNRSNYIPHPTDAAGTWDYYADSCTASGVNGAFSVNWNPVSTGRGGTIVFWVVYGDEVQVAAGTGTAPHNTSAPKTYRCTDVASASGETFAPTTVFLLAADTTSSVGWLEGTTAALNLDFDTDAGMSFGMGTANPDGTNLAFRSLTWRDASGAGTSASGLYFSDDYVVVGEVNTSGAIASPQLFDSVSDTGFTLDLRTGLTGFDFAFLALRSEIAEIKLETFTTPSATGYADQAIGAPLGNPQGVLMIQTQVPNGSVDQAMTNPVSATWGIGMGHQTTLSTDPVTHSVSFQVEDNSGTSDTQSSYAPQLGYLVKKHGASATVSNFDWATHTAGSADAASVDWVTNTTATGVTLRQWAGLFVGYGQQIFVGLNNDEAIPATTITVSEPTVEGSEPPQRITLTSTGTMSVTGTHPASAGLSSCMQTETPTVALRLDQPSIKSLGTVTDPRNEPVAAVSIGDAAGAVMRAEPVAASVVSDAVAGWSRTEPVAATAVLDLVGSR
jgi:hypothetical protein